MRELFLTRDRDGISDNCGVFLRRPRGMTDQGLWYGGDDDLLGVITPAQAERAFGVDLEPGQMVPVPLGEVSEPPVPGCA